MSHALKTDSGQTAEYSSGDVVAGRYVLDRPLGAGGMGVVWVARSIPLDVDVALKMLRREAAGAESAERLAREARALAQLGHPALVRVLDFGATERGVPFLAMELLRGDTLSTLLERHHRLTPERAVALLLPIIDGLGTAHDKGIVHRDIKPDNIFIARDEHGRIQPKLLDFGIAKYVPAASPSVSRLTEVGVVLGSPQYLSPEQAEGLDEIDFRADIWAVGVVLYELVTGATPFEGKNYNALMRSIRQHQPNDFLRLGLGDAQLWAIVERCLKKLPRLRWNSMWELGEALALWLYERGERIDASSRSLKDGWLAGRGPLQGILSASDAPMAHAERAGGVPPEAPLIVAARPTAPPTLLRPPVEARRRGPAVVVAAVIAVVVATGIFFAGRATHAPATRHDPTEGTAHGDVTAATTAAARSVPPDVPETEPAAPPVVVTATPAEVVTTPSAGAPTAPSPPRAQPSARTAPKPRRDRPGIDAEFGF